MSRWQEQRVVVTGADGFMGSHMCEALIAAGAKVTAMVRGSSTLGTIKQELKHLNVCATSLDAIVAVDIGSNDAVSLIREAQPEYIFHLAAVAYVPYSFSRPREVFQSNVVGSLNVLEAARDLPSLRRLVMCSSSEVYGSATTDAIDEDHPLNPTSPYAASKVAADRYAHSYHMTYGVPLTVLRPFNYYGPRHAYDVIPKFIEMVLRNEPPTVHGTGEQRRDFTYVSDMVEGFLTAAESDVALGGVYNLGSGADVSIHELARIIIDVVGASVEPIFTPHRTSEVARLTCDASRAREAFGWAPKVDLREGITRFVEWYRARRSQQS